MDKIRADLELLLAWWNWSHIDSGIPKGFARGWNIDYQIPTISDEDADKLERAVMALQKRLPREYHALLEWCRAGGNATQAAKWLGESPPTVRTYVQRAGAWVDAWLQCNEPFC